MVQFFKIVSIFNFSVWLKTVNTQGKKQIQLLQSQTAYYFDAVDFKIIQYIYGFCLCDVGVGEQVIIDEKSFFRYADTQWGVVHQQQR